MTLPNYWQSHSAQGLFRKLLALNFIGFAAGICWAGTNNQLDYTFGLGFFNFTLSVCKFFLILFGGMVAVYVLATADIVDIDLTEVSGCSSSIVVLMNLCVAGIAPGFDSSLCRVSSTFPGMQVVLVIALGVGLIFCGWMIELYLDLGWLPSDRLTSFTIPGSVFTDCPFFLILLSGALVFDSVHLVQWVEDANSFTVVSVGLNQMFAIVILSTLYAVGIAGIDLEFGGSLHRITNSFPGMQVVLVFMTLAVGSRAFFRVLEVLPLDLGLLPSNQIASLAPGSIFMLTSLLFLVGMLTSLHLVQWGATELTAVSGWFTIWAVLVLMILCTARIIDSATGFGNSIHSLSTCAFPDIQVVLVMALDVWASFTCHLGLTEVLHLDLVLLPSVQISCFTIPGIQVVAFGVGLIAFCLVMTADVLLDLLSSLHQVD